MQQTPGTTGRPDSGFERVDDPEFREPQEVPIAGVEVSDPMFEAKSCDVGVMNQVSGHTRVSYQTRRNLHVARGL